MSKLSTTKMSSKGQIVIPEDIRKSLGLNPGDQFVVVGDKDVIMLKVITPPSLDDFEGLVNVAREQAKKVGLKKADIKEAIKKSRK